MDRVYLRPFIILLLLGFCSLFYYFGELVDWAAWNALRNDYFYGIHDIHRLLFLAPIIYAGYTGRVKGAVIVTLISFAIFLPRAFIISPYPDPLLRMVLFVIFVGVIGSLVGIIRNQSVESRRMATVIAGERNRLFNILNALADGVIITDQDYRIRYMNLKMVGVFGDGIGYTCHQYLHNLESPCPQECHIMDVINNGNIGKWRCNFPDDKAYEVVAAPYIDVDGTICQISVFRNITR